MSCLYHRVASDTPCFLPPMTQAAPSASFHYLKSPQHGQRRILAICDPTTPISRSCCCSAHLSHRPPLTHFCLNRWGHTLKCNSLRCQLSRHGGRSPPAASAICAEFVLVHIRAHVIAACMSQLWLTSRSHGECVYMKVHVNQDVLCFCETKYLCDCLTLKDFVVSID